MSFRKKPLRDQATVMALFACSGDTFPDVRGKALVPYLEQLVAHTATHIDKARTAATFRHDVAVAVRRNRPAGMDQVLLDYGFLDDTPEPAT